jgi:hypothetical protein
MLHSASSEEVFVNFVQAATFEYLHARRAYPDEFFEERRAFGASVHASRHAQLTEYVVDALKSSVTWLNEGRLRCISCRLCEPVTGNTLEKLDFECIPGGSGPANLEYFRACLVRLGRLRIKPLQHRGVRFALKFLVADVASPGEAFILSDEYADSDQHAEQRSIVSVGSIEGDVCASVYIDTSLDLDWN